MGSLEIVQILNASFWNEYTALWRDSREKSPFQAPEILKYFSEKLGDKVLAIRLVDEGNLLASVVFKKENGIYSFLSDLKTGANFFVFHRDCSDDNVTFFFTRLLDFIKQEGWTVTLNVVAGWAPYFQAFAHHGAKSKLFFQVIDYSVCPIVECDKPEGVWGIVNKSRMIRIAANKLKGKLKAEFEIFTGDEDLECWVREFCACHIRRWSNTSTPSVFRSRNYQSFFLKCLRAWIADNVLARFSVKINQQRVGFQIVLIDKNSLIGHSQAYDPDFCKLSPAKVLLLTISEWMKVKGLSVLDFGDGAESYKYRFTNKERVLKRVMICRRTNYLFVAKSKLIKLIRSNAGIYNFYKRVIKRYLNQLRYAKTETGSS